jgi:hypothetical protein
LSKFLLFVCAPEQEPEMKAARHLFVIIILLFILMSIVACIITGGGGGGTDNSSARGSISGDDATATYGAEQFHLQLTAISRDQMTPAADAP